MTCHTETLIATPIVRRLMQRAELEHELEVLHPANFAWSLACCRRNREDAEEVLQTVYVKVLEGSARFDGHSSLKTWLFAVIRRSAAAFYRRRSIRDALLLRFFDRTDSVDPTSSEPHLLRAIHALPQRQREILELVFYHDMTVDTAAGVMGVSAGTARVHYDRAKKRMRELLEVKR